MLTLLIFVLGKLQTGIQSLCIMTSILKNAIKNGSKREWDKIVFNNIEKTYRIAVNVIPHFGSKKITSEIFLPNLIS